MGTVHRENVVVGDATVSALVVGEGQPVVLLHGIPTSAEVWRPLFDPLVAAGFQVLAVDLPGYGATRLPASAAYSLAGAAALLARWMDQQDLPSAWVVGHDAGGAVAQVLAVAHPERVARLTLVNSIADGSWPAPRARVATLAARLGLYRVAARIGIVPNPYLRWQIRRGFADPATAASVDVDAIVWDTKVSDPAGRRAFERHLAALDPADTARIVPGLRQLAMPCQLVWGMGDVFQRWETAGQRLEQLLPSPAVTNLDDCGHFVPLDCPDRLAAAMMDWYAEAPV